MGKLDGVRYANAGAYVATLPDGLASFSACRMNRHVLAHVGIDFPDLFAETDAPPLVMDFFKGRTPGDWINEATGNAIYLMIRDRYFGDDSSFRSWNQTNIERLVRNPVFRAIMVLLSPSLVVMGAGKRWGSFHQGTEMKTESMGQAGGRMQVRGRLTFPEGLYNRLLLELHCSTFLAALVVARATEPEVRLVGVAPGQAEYVASWLK